MLTTWIKHANFILFKWTTDWTLNFLLNFKQILDRETDILLKCFRYLFIDYSLLLNQNLHFKRDDFKS